MRSAIAAGLALLAAPVKAQTMDHAQHDMAGMKMGAMKMDGMAGMDHSTAAPAPAGDDAAPAADTPGNAPPPPVPTDNAADRLFPAARMEAARAAMMMEGHWRGSAVMLDQLEYRAGAGQDGYAWKGSAWYGGDIDRLVLATEGEGQFGARPERAELGLLWRHAVDPYWNVEAGVRHDVQPGPQRTYAVLGVEGLAPYWIETEAQAFVSNKGDMHLRLAASHDLRLSGPLVLQPAAEVNVALQDVPDLGIGAGFERIELGARLRYEFRPEFAPYVGVNWERSLGGTARATRASGDSASAVTGVVGLHAFF
jgi:copper resistance protein B